MMKKFFVSLFAILALCTSAKANDLSLDTADPLFLLKQNSVLSQTNLTYWDNILRAGQTLSFGVNDKFSIGANVHYQQDFDGREDGFSSIDLGGIYRLSNASDNSAKIISDVLFGFKFGGSSKVRTPYYADSTYYAGLRFGRQWAGVTLAADLKSSWIFDDLRGMAYIDFEPQAYFRVTENWRIGTGIMFRKATNPVYDQEWLKFKFLRQYGRTQYIGLIDYEFESKNALFGLQVNILF